MKLMPPTRNCKICFKQINNNDVCRLFNKNIEICSECQKAMNPLFISFSVLNYKAFAIYEYNDFIRKTIYQFKGCFDYELADVFIHNYAREIKLMFSKYTLVPIPSYQEDDELRGFNHVIEIYKKIGLKVLPILEKIEHHKQATKSAISREKIYKFLKLKKKIDLRKKDILIVDDIYTTGATIKSAINIIEKLNPRKIMVLVIAKTKTKSNNKQLIP